MKIRIALSISLLLFIILTTSGQSVQSVRFSYDANGNRKSRKIIVEELPVETIPPNPVPLSLNQSPEAKKGKQQLADIDINPDEQTILKVSDDECRVLIYPNPTKGILKIVVNNMPINRVSEFRLYDMSGTELIIKKNFPEYYEMDISHLRDGIYILRIKINMTLFDFKVIKNQ